MASPDRSSSSKQGRKTPHLKPPLFEPKTLTVRSTKLASFSDMRPGLLHRYQDNIDQKNKEKCINQAEDAIVKGEGAIYDDSYTGKASVKEAMYSDNQTEKSTSEGMEYTNIDIKRTASKSVEYGESPKEADIKKLASGFESLSSDGGSPVKNKTSTKFVHQLKSYDEDQLVKDNMGSGAQSATDIERLNKQTLLPGMKIHDKTIGEILELDTEQLGKRHKDEVAIDRKQGHSASLKQNCDKNETSRPLAVSVTAAESVEIKSGEKGISRINSNLFIKKDRSLDENRMTNIVNKAQKLDTKQQEGEMEMTAIKDLHLQHEGENAVMAQQNNGCSKTNGNRGIAGMVSDTLDRGTHRSNNRKDDSGPVLTHCEIKIYEKNDLLCLIQKYPIQIKGNVKITVDLQQGFLTISGVDEVDVEEVENLVTCKLDDVRTDRVVIPEYQVPFVKKERIQDLINEALDQRHISCYWRLDESYILITAWEKEAVDGWHTVYKELFYHKELEVSHDQRANMKLVNLYRSQYWEMVENGIRDKFGNFFSVGEFNKDGQRYLGFIAHEKIFKDVWNELEFKQQMLLCRSFRTSENDDLDSKQALQVKNMLETSCESNERFEEDKNIVQAFSTEACHSNQMKIEDRNDSDLKDEGKMRMKTDGIVQEGNNPDTVKGDRNKNEFDITLVASQIDLECSEKHALQENLEESCCSKKAENTDTSHAEYRDDSATISEHQILSDQSELSQGNNVDFKHHKNKEEVAKSDLQEDQMQTEKQTAYGSYQANSVTPVALTETINPSKCSVTETQEQKKSKLGFTDGYQIEHQAENVTVDVGALDSVVEQAQPTESVQTPNKDNEKKPKPPEGDNTPIKAKPGMTGQIVDKNISPVEINRCAKETFQQTSQDVEHRVFVEENIGQQTTRSKALTKFELGKESKHWHADEKQVGQKAMGTVDYYSDCESQKYPDHGLEDGKKEGQQVKTIKDSNTVHETRSMSKDRLGVKVKEGQQVNRSRDDEMELEAATSSFQALSIFDHDGEQGTRSEDSSDKLEVQTQHKDAEPKTDIIKDTNTVHGTRSTSKERLGVGRQVGKQVNESKDNEMKLEAETGSFHKPLLGEYERTRKTRSEDSNNKLEVEKQHKDAESKTAIIKDTITVHGAGNTSKDRTRDRQVGHQVNQSKDEEMKDSVTDSCPDQSLKENDEHQATRNKDYNDKLKVGRQYKDSESKIVMINDSNTVHGADTTSKDRLEDKRQTGQEVNQSKHDEMELREATDSCPEPAFCEYGGLQTTESEDGYNKLAIETQYTDAESKTAKLTDNGSDVEKKQETSSVAVGGSLEIETKENAGTKLIESAERTLLTVADNDIYRWKFAVTCPTVYKRICDFLKTEIHVTDEGHVKVKEVRSELCEQVVRNAFSKASTDVKENIYSFNACDWEEIEGDFDMLRARKITRNRPVNPYATRDAQISVVKRQNKGEVFLMAMDIYFEACCKDVIYILKKYENENSEHTDEAQGQRTDFYENKQSQMSIKCEKWKFDHLQKSVKGISKYKKDFSVEISLEGEDKVLIKGREPVKVTQVTTELQRQIKTVVKIVPALDDLYVWKFAFSCPEVTAQIKQNIPGTVSEDLAHGNDDDDNILIIQFDSEENIISEQRLRYIISEACKDVKLKMFTSTKNLKDDIERAIIRFKEPIPKENPFSLERAKVFLVAENSEYKIILVTLSAYFKQCCDLIDRVINGDVKEAKEGLDGADDGKHPAEKKILQEEKSVSINCEKWKYNCLTNIGNRKDKLEKKFNITIEMKDESTLYIQGEEPRNVEQVRTDLCHKMKKLVKEIEPITEESYENLEADQNYKNRIGVFENKHHIVVELGKVLDFETDVEIHVGGLDMILLKNVRTEGLLTVELIKAGHGMKCVVKEKEIPWENLNELVGKLIKLCTDSIVIMLDTYEGQMIELTSFIADIITCLQGYSEKGDMDSLYICTETHEKFFGVKELLQKFDQPVRAPIRPKRDQAISIEVIKGELAKQKVDVILNSSNTKLQLDQGVVSKSLLNVAGKEMQNEIRENYPFGIRPGEIAETKGYRLKAHHVFHSCLSTWNVHVPENNKVCLENLHQIVKKSLERTEQLHRNTIAFPALGTGVLKFPFEVVAKEMISTILSYNRENPQTSIQKVFFVIYYRDQGLYKVFTQTLEQLISANKMPDPADSNLKYCVVLSGSKEHVTKAKAKITEELLQPAREISGNSQMRTDTQNLNFGPLNAGHHAQSQDGKPANQSGQTLNMAARVGDDTTHRAMANNQIQSHEQSGGIETTEPEAVSLDSDPTYDKIVVVNPGLTPDKGAIPKKPDWARKGKQSQPIESFDDPGSHDNSKDETTPEMTTRPKADKRKEIDPSCDSILDKYLEQITVSLDKECITGLHSTKFDDMVKTLEEHGIEINQDELTLKGKARNLATVEKVVTDMINGKITSDTPEKGSDGDDYDDDDDSDDDVYENLDHKTEEDILEKSLSQRFSKEAQQKQLKNVRREVYKLMNILYETELKENSRDCQVEFNGNDLTLHCKDYETLGEVYNFVKQSLTQLDDYYYCELDPTKPVDDIMKVVRQIQSQAKGTWDKIHVFEDDGMVRLAGKSFEQVDEFRKIVEVQLSGNQPSSRANRKLDAKLGNRFDKGNASNTSKDKCKVFCTDEGIKIFVYKASILQLEVDCIVNAANSKLTHTGGIAKVIAQAAGSSFEKESRDYIATHGKLQVGSSCITTAGKLHYKRVIQTVGPNIGDYRNDEVDKVNKDLHDAIYSCLDCAKANQFQSIGIPSVSSGIFGVPKKWCALQYCQAVEDFSRKNSSCCLREIHFVDVNEEMLDVIKLSCEAVFLSNKTAKKELENFKCSPNKHQRIRVPRFLKGKKNIVKKKTKDVYPRIVSSRHAKLKIEVSPGLTVVAVKENIVDFRKGVIVCPQDLELNCEEQVAKAIIKHESYYHGNLMNKYGKQKREFGDVLVIGSKCLSCSSIYNVVVPQKMKTLETLSLCYMQVLQKADENKIEKIAVPLFITDSDKHVSECAQILMTVLIELVNTKGKYHRFPNVYIYIDNEDAVQTVTDVMKQMLIEKYSKDWERSPIDEDQKSVYHTPPTSPVLAKRHQIGKQVSATSQQSIDISGRVDDRKQNTNEEEIDDGAEIFESMNFEQHDGSKAQKDDDREDIYESMNFKRHDRSKGEKDGDSAESVNCVICMDSFTNPKTLSKCGHTFCTDCIEQSLKVKPVCPVCSTPYGILTGTQPVGEMKTEVHTYPSLPGYEGCGYTKITYRFPDGTQQEDHPNPGKPYRGTRRVAYLPNNPEGQKVLKLLKVAFDRKLIFTVGRSVTTGTENIVTWNDIHHKTKMFGGPSNYGYPDPHYLKRVTDELEAKGVTENDIA